MTWYDGGKQPSPELVKDTELSSNGIILIGDKDTLYVPNYWGAGKFLSGAKVEDFKDIPETLPKPPGFERNHHQEWLNACKGGPKALSNFDYSGPMTEAVLQVYEGQSHAHYLRDDTAPETKEAFAEISGFFDKHMGK